jgi:ribose transport system substrate-binding protein
VTSKRRTASLIVISVLVFSACSTVAPSVSPSAPATPATTTASPGASASDAATPAPSMSAYSLRLAKDKATMVDTTKYKKDGPYTIGATAQGTFNGWGLMVDVGLKWSATQHPEIKQLIVNNGDGDANKQIGIVEDFISQKVDAIVLDPLGAAALSAPAARAMAAGIPVVICLNGLEGDDYVTHIDVDLYQTAYDVATDMANAMGGQGNAIILNGIPGVDAAEVWKQAAEDALANFPNIEVVGNEYTNWSVATATTTVASLLSRAGTIDGVYAGGSEMAIGAINALTAANQPMPKFGVNNPLNGFLRLAIEKNLTFSAAPDAPGIAPLCVDYALKVLKGETVSRFIDINEALPDAKPYDQSKAQQFYKPAFNDDYIYPTLVPDDVALAAGFGR